MMNNALIDRQLLKKLIAIFLSVVCMYVPWNNRLVNIDESWKSMYSMYGTMSV